MEDKRYHAWYNFTNETVSSSSITSWYNVLTSNCLKYQKYKIANLENNHSLSTTVRTHYKIATVSNYHHSPFQHPTTIQYPNSNSTPYSPRRLLTVTFRTKSKHFVGLTDYGATIRQRAHARCNGWLGTKATLVLITTDSVMTQRPYWLTFQKRARMKSQIEANQTRPANVITTQASLYHAIKISGKVYEYL